MKIRVAIPQKYTVVGLIFTIMLPTFNIIQSDSDIVNDPITGLEENFEIQIPNLVKEQDIISDFQGLDGHFTKNVGQVENSNVKYYIQGKCVWFLRDSVVFQFWEPQNERSKDPMGKGNSNA